MTAGIAQKRPFGVRSQSHKFLDMECPVICNLIKHVASGLASVTDYCCLHLLQLMHRQQFHPLEVRSDWQSVIAFRQCGV